MPTQARELLEQGVQTDHDTKLSPLAWLALFDLQQRAGDKTAFDQFALQYVVQFERSAPPWEASGEAATRAAGKLRGLYRTRRKVRLPGGDATRGAKARDGETGLRGSPRPHVGDGFRRRRRAPARDALGDARRKKFTIQLQRAEKLKPILDAMVKKGREGGEGRMAAVARASAMVERAMPRSRTAQSNTR